MGQVHNGTVTKWDTLCNCSSWTTKKRWQQQGWLLSINIHESWQTDCPPSPRPSHNTTHAIIINNFQDKAFTAYVSSPHQTTSLLTLPQKQFVSPRSVKTIFNKRKFTWQQQSLRLSYFKNVHTQSLLRLDAPQNRYISSCHKRSTRSVRAQDVHHNPTINCGKQNLGY